MKGKHTIKRKKNSFKYFLFIILILLIALFIYNLKSKKSVNTYTSSDYEVKHNTNEEIFITKTVENAEYLEITGLDITFENGFSTIKTTIKNNSLDTLTDFRLDISIFDENNNLVTELSNPIQSISPNESLESFGVIQKDISNTYRYTVKKN